MTKTKLVAQSMAYSPAAAVARTASNLAGGDLAQQRLERRAAPATQQPWHSVCRGAGIGAAAACHAA